MSCIFWEWISFRYVHYGVPITLHIVYVKNKIRKTNKQKWMNEDELSGDLPNIETFFKGKCDLIDSGKLKNEYSEPFDVASVCWFR